MGLIKWHSIVAQFRPTDIADITEVTPSPQEVTEKDDVDTEVQKPTQRTVVESGVARVEVLQAVWGKYGKHLIIAG